MTINLYKSFVFKYTIRLIALSIILFPAPSMAMTEDDLLEAEAAFAISSRLKDERTLTVDYIIAEGYYLYKHKIKFETSTPGIQLGEPIIPDGKKHVDDFFGEVETFRQILTIELPFKLLNDFSGQVEIDASSQGCADLGVCYPVLTQPVLFSINGNADTDAKPAQESVLSEQDSFAAKLSKGNLWLTIVAFFAAGILLAFTPCVLPMIPILSSIIVGQGKKISTLQAFSLSLVYVLAMAVTYTIAGIIVGKSGENVQALFQNPWILSVFAGVFVLLSLAMFGFYELQMPQSVQSRLSALSNTQEGGTYISAGIMGFLSALIVGPCVTAPLIGALIYIAQTGDAALGGLALFALSMGMGLPLIIIGTSAGKLIPKAGTWMDNIKKSFGVLMLGLAIWLLERILPITIIMFLFGVLLIGSAIYMGLFESIKEGSSPWFKLWKAFSLVLLLYGMLLITGASMGGNSLLQPLKGVFSGTPNRNAHDLFQQIKGIDGLENALQKAEQTGQMVLLDFYADWCVSCKEMESFTFTDPKVEQLMSSFVLLQTDVTDNDELDKALLKSLGLFGPPAILFYTSDQNELRNMRVVGYMPADKFSTHLGKVLAKPQSL